MKNIETLISESLKSLYGVDFFPEISPAPKPELGEYCVNIFPIVKQVGKAPNIISEEVAKELAKHSDIFKNTSATGGYVNFFLSDRVWMEIFSKIGDLNQKDKNGKNAIMEIFSLNVGKPLHIGHLCPTSTGQAIVNVHRYLGWNIIVDNHMGDWGSLFGKLIVGYQKYGNDKKLHSDGVEHLQELYVQITADIETNPEVDEECKEAFRKLSKGDKELMELWGEFTRTSLEKANAVVAKLHVYNDVAIGEAFYEGLPLPKIGEHPDLVYNMDSIVAELIEKKIATKNEDGSVGIVFSEETKLPSTILEKRDGTHGYLASDLACVKYRMTNGWNPDKISIGTDVRQALHFKQVFATAKLAGWIPEGIELIHVGNGFISLPDGAMSSRKGNIIRLEDLMEEAFVRTKKILESKGRQLSDSDIQEIAIGAIKYSYLMQDRERNIVFDWDKALNFEGNSGPYIQYACVRAKKILKDVSLEALSDEQMELSSHDKSLIQMLARFDEVVATVAKTYKPHHLALYAYDVAVAFNSFYVHTPKILEEKDENIRNFRLALVKKSSETIEIAFDLLGIKMPSEM
ncbi:MAG: arginine--tRNA ligase [Candidatus Altimarinota bacterium]